MLKKSALAILKYNSILTLLGAFIVLVTYVVKDNLLDKWKHLEEKIPSSISDFNLKILSIEAKANSDAVVLQDPIANNTEAAKIAMRVRLYKNEVLNRNKSLNELLDASDAPKGIKLTSEHIKVATEPIMLITMKQPSGTRAIDNLSEVRAQLDGVEKAEIQLERDSLKQLEMLAAQNRTRAFWGGLWVNVLFGIGWVLSILPTAAKIVVKKDREKTSDSGS